MRKELEWIRWKKNGIRIGWKARNGRKDRRSQKDRQNRIEDSAAAVYLRDIAGRDRSLFRPAAVRARQARREARERQAPPGLPVPRERRETREQLAPREQREARERQVPPGLPVPRARREAREQLALRGPPAQQARPDRLRLRNFLPRFQCRQLRERPGQRWFLT